MHSIVLLTALSATTGLFGGGSCRGGACGGQAYYGYAPQYSHYSYQYTYQQSCATCGVAPRATAPAPQAAVAPAQQPVPQTAVPVQQPAPRAAAPVQQTGYYYNYSYNAAYFYPAASCATGNCPYR